MQRVEVVENGVEVKRTIDQLMMHGYKKDDIYLFAHDENRSENLTESLNTEEVGVEEQGFFGSIANVFRTRGDELRAKFESLGLSNAEAEQYEEELDHGRWVVVAVG